MTQNISFSLGNRQASRLIVFMMTGSIFASLVIDGWRYMNSSWLCLIFGLILAFPLILIAEKNIKKGRRPVRPMLIVVSAYYIYKTAALTRLLINSLSYSNLETVPPLIVSAVILLIFLYVISKNGSGIGNAAKICLILCLLLSAVIIISNLNYMNLRWLTPLIGCSIKDIAAGSISAAGSILAPMLIYFAADANCTNSCSLIKSSLTGFAAGIVICIYGEIMTPMLPLLQGNRLQSIELLLSNGRTSLGVQLPVTLLWFLGLILSAASYAFSGAFILDYAVSSVGSKLAGIICITAAFIAANTGLAESYIMEKVQLFIYPVSAVIIASAALHRRNAHEISS